MGVFAFGGGGLFLFAYGPPHRGNTNKPITKETPNAADTQCIESAKKHEENTKNPKQKAQRKKRRPKESPAPQVPKQFHRFTQNSAPTHTSLRIIWSNLDVPASVRACRLPAQAHPPTLSGPTTQNIAQFNMRRYGPNETRKTGNAQLRHHPQRS